MYQRYSIKSQELLKQFSTVAPAERSVYVCRTRHDDFLRLAILNIIQDELLVKGLVARYLGDNVVPYNPLAQPNRDIYLEGCNYAIVLLERLPIRSYIPTLIDPIVCYEYGCMTQQNKKILILYDEDSMKIRNAESDGQTIYFEDPFEGLNKSIFYTSESHLQTLRTQVANWTSKLKESKDD